MKIAHISDTHYPRRLNWSALVPKCDVLVHTGDMTMMGKHHEWFLQICVFEDLLQDETCKHIVCVPGNHDGDFDNFRRMCRDSKYSDRIHLLEAELVDIDGITFFGMPWAECLKDWWYYQDLESLDDRVSRLIEVLPKVDVLLTHFPPMGQLDDYGVDILTGEKILGGSLPALRLLNALRPKLHCFGHIHEKPGRVIHGCTDLSNGCALDGQYNVDKARPATILHVTSGEQCACAEPCDITHVPGLGRAPLCQL